MNGIYYAIFSQIHYLSLSCPIPPALRVALMKTIIICATVQAPPGNHQSSSRREKKARVLELATSKIQDGVFAKELNFEIFSHF